MKEHMLLETCVPLRTPVTETMAGISRPQTVRNPVDHDPFCGPDFTWLRWIQK